MHTKCVFSVCGLLVLLSVPAASGQRPLGIDVSVYTPLTATDWTNIRNSGRVFAFARASYGWGGVDTEFVNHMSRGRAAGLYMGAYHFEYAGYDANHTPINEANSFLNVARSYIIAGYLRPVLDVEYIGPSLGGLTLTQWCTQWMNYVQQQTGVEPLIYTGAYFAQAYLDSSICSRDLWIAAWPANPNPQTDNPAYLWLWPTWRFWQYAGDVTIPGVTTQKVDLNVFNGTLEVMQQSFVIPSGNPATISRSPAALGPIASFGHSPLSQTFTVANTGGGTLGYSITSDSTWMSVNPASGSSTGEADTMTVTYSAASLAVGTYHGALTISASGASNSPQTIDVTLTVAVPGDMDGDGDIDVIDASLLANCMTGPGAAITDLNCMRADLGSDGHVDQSDFGALQKCLSGPAVPADPNCVG